MKILKFKVWDWISKIVAWSSKKNIIFKKFKWRIRMRTLENCKEVVFIGGECPLNYKRNINPTRVQNTRKVEKIANIWIWAHLCRGYCLSPSQLQTIALKTTLCRGCCLVHLYGHRWSLEMIIFGLRVVATAPSIGCPHNVFVLSVLPHLNFDLRTICTNRLLSRFT